MADIGDSWKGLTVTNGYLHAADFDSWQDWATSSGTLTYNTVVLPTSKLKCKGNKSTLKLALPGVKKEDLEITVTKDTLEISLEEGTTFVGSFTSAWDTKGYDAKNAKTSLVDGVLEIIMEKKDSYKPKKLKI